MESKHLKLGAVFFIVIIMLLAGMGFMGASLIDCKWTECRSRLFYLSSIYGTNKVVDRARNGSTLQGEYKDGGSVCIRRGYG